MCLYSKLKNLKNGNALQVFPVRNKHITRDLKEKKDYSINQRQKWKPVSNYYGERFQIEKGFLSSRKNSKVRFNVSKMRLEKFELETANFSCELSY